MYIVKCDRCGKEKTVKNILPVFGDDKPEHVPKYVISSFGEDGANTIYLCEKCEEEFTEFLAEKALDGE